MKGKSPVRPLTLTTWILALVLPGCGLVMGSASARLANNVSTAILSQNDIETVRDGAPAYLIMLDGLIAGDPESPALLLAGAQLYGAYGTAFVEEPARRRRLTERSLAYGRRALCAETNWAITGNSSVFPYTHLYRLEPRPIQ